MTQASSLVAVMNIGRETVYKDKAKAEAEGKGDKDVVTLRIIQGVNNNRMILLHDETGRQERSHQTERIHQTHTHMQC